MMYDDLKKQAEIYKRMCEATEKILTATKQFEVYDNKNVAQWALNELARLRSETIEKEFNQHYCDGCHFCWHDKEEDRYLCTARGFYVKPYQVRECGLYMKEGVV